MRFLLSILAFAAASSLFLGCQRKTYEVELHPDGPRMNRTLRVISVVSEESARATISDADRARIAPFYRDDQVTYREHEVEFSATFDHKMPADVGGAGSIDYFENRLGAVSHYMERFRGDDDLKSQLLDRQQAVDELTDLLVGWVDTAFEGSAFEESDFEESDFEDPDVRTRLRDFVDSGLRKDLHNLLLYAWTAASIETDGIDDSDQPQVTVMARIIQYLIERDYFDVADVPRITRAFQSESSDDVAGLIRGALIRKLDFDDSALPQVAQAQWLKESLEKYLRSTPQFESLVAEKSESGPTAEPDEGDVIIRLLLRIWPNFFSGGESIVVTLHLDEPPMHTNGTWDQEAKTVTWSRPLKSSPMPAFVHATWVTADVANQMRCFGRVLVTGKDLANYTQWVAGLSTEEAKQWNGMLDSLDGQDNLDATIETLGEFQFDGLPEFADPITDHWIKMLGNPPDAAVQAGSTSSDAS